MSVARQFRGPTTIFVGGATQCGKTEFIRKLINNRAAVFTDAPENVYFCYGAWQGLYVEMQQEDGKVQFQKTFAVIRTFMPWAADSHLL